MLSISARIACAAMVADLSEDNKLAPSLILDQKCCTEIKTESLQMLAESIQELRFCKDNSNIHTTSENTSLKKGSFNLPDISVQSSSETYTLNLQAQNLRQPYFLQIILQQQKSIVINFSNNGYQQKEEKLKALKEAISDYKKYFKHETVNDIKLNDLSI